MLWVGGGLVLFLAHRTLPSLRPEVEQVLMPYFFKVRFIWWKAGPGMYGIRQYGVFSVSSLRSWSRNGRTSNKLSGVSVSVLVLLALVCLLLVLDLFFKGGG